MSEFLRNNATTRRRQLTDGEGSALSNHGGKARLGNAAGIVVVVVVDSVLREFSKIRGEIEY